MDHFDGLIPFDFKTEPADSNSKYLGEYSQRYQQQHMWTLFRVIHGSALLLWLSEPPLLGAHLLLQWPFVRCGGEEACVGLRPHRHTAACGDHQPRWVDLWWPIHHWGLRGTLSEFCFFVTVMMEFPMVWQWWLALGKIDSNFIDTVSLWKHVSFYAFLFCLP